MTPLAKFDLRWRVSGEQGTPPSDNNAGIIVLDPPGPGPVHGQADNHFVILAPDLSETWFFEVGRLYWDRFKPTLMPIYDFINFFAAYSIFGCYGDYYPRIVRFDE